MTVSARAGFSGFDLGFLSTFGTAADILGETNAGAIADEAEGHAGSSRFFIPDSSRSFALSAAARASLWVQSTGLAASPFLAASPQLFDIAAYLVGAMLFGKTAAGLITLKAMSAVVAVPESLPRLHTVNTGWQTSQDAFALLRTLLGDAYLRQKKVDFALLDFANKRTMAEFLFAQGMMPSEEVSLSADGNSNNWQISFREGPPRHQHHQIDVNKDRFVQRVRQIIENERPSMFDMVFWAFCNKYRSSDFDQGQFKLALEELLRKKGVGFARVEEAVFIDPSSAAMGGPKFRDGDKTETLYFGQVFDILTGMFRRDIDVAVSELKGPIPVTFVETDSTSRDTVVANCLRQMTREDCFQGLTAGEEEMKTAFWDAVTELVRQHILREMVWDTPKKRTFLESIPIHDIFRENSMMGHSAYITVKLVTDGGFRHRVDFRRETVVRLMKEKLEAAKLEPAVGPKAGPTAAIPPLHTVRSAEGESYDQMDLMELLLGAQYLRAQHVSASLLNFATKRAMTEVLSEVVGTVPKNASLHRRLVGSFAIRYDGGETPVNLPDFTGRIKRILENERPSAFDLVFWGFCQLYPDLSVDRERFKAAVIQTLASKISGQFEDVEERVVIDENSPAIDDRLVINDGRYVYFHHIREALESTQTTPAAVAAPAPVTAKAPPPPVSTTDYVLEAMNTREFDLNIHSLMRERDNFFSTSFDRFSKKEREGLLRVAVLRVLNRKAQAELKALGHDRQNIRGSVYLDFLNWNGGCISAILNNGEPVNLPLHWEGFVGEVRNELRAMPSANVSPAILPAAAAPASGPIVEPANLDLAFAKFSARFPDSGITREQFVSAIAQQPVKDRLNRIKITKVEDFGIETLLDNQVYVTVRFETYFERIRGFYPRTLKIPRIAARPAPAAATPAPAARSATAPAPARPVVAPPARPAQAPRRGLNVRPGSYVLSQLDADLASLSGLAPRTLTNRLAQSSGLRVFVTECTSTNGVSTLKLWWWKAQGVKSFATITVDGQNIKDVQVRSGR